MAGGVTSSSTTSTSSSTPQIIPLSRRRRRHRLERPVNAAAEASGDKGQAALLTGFEEDVYAYFASLEVVGPGSSSVQVRRLDLWEWVSVRLSNHGARTPPTGLTPLTTFR